MKETEILNRFNNEGIFPSDAELQIIADERGLGESILDVELELLDVASSDVNHPYYPANQPIPESEKSEAQKEFEKMINEKLDNMIEINITLYGKTKTFKMGVDEWFKQRDAQFGVSPCDEKVGELLSEFT